MEKSESCQNAKTPIRKSHFETCKWMVLDSNVERNTQKWGFLNHPKSDQKFLRPKISYVLFAANSLCSCIAIQGMQFLLQAV